MRVIIASDIHGRINAAKKLDRILSLFRPDRIFLLGDFLYNGPRNGVPSDYDPMGTAEILNRYASKIIAVRGNCDSRVDEMVLKFPLEDSRVLNVNGYRCGLVHGDLLTSELINVQRGNILMFGHTHIPSLKKEDGVIYLNPGSVAFPKAGNPATYAVMEGRHIEIRKLDGYLPIASLDLN